MCGKLTGLGRAALPARPSPPLPPPGSLHPFFHSTPFQATSFRATAPPRTPCSLASSSVRRGWC